MAPEMKPDQGRKFNPNNFPSSQNDNNNSPKNRFRPNIYWIYLIILGSIVCYTLMRGVTGGSVQISPQVFKEMMLQGDVQEYKVIRNQSIVRVSVNPDSLNKKAAR